MLSKIEYKLPKSPIDVSYYNLFFGYSKKLKKNVYICHITIKDLVTVKNLRFIYKTNSMAIKHLVKSDLNIRKNNSIIYTLYKLENGVNFIVDLKMFNKAQKFKDDIELNSNITLGGIVIQINPLFLNKNFKAILTLAKFFGVKFKIRITTSDDESLLAVEKLAKLN